ncbi:MAG: formate dehydrogenase accessory sulfurtransferase FdhD [Pseudomonadota bacterium]
MNIKTIDIIKYSASNLNKTNDQIAVEEPLSIFVNNELFYTTMRLPGEEIPLSVGILYSEKILSSFNDIEKIDYCTEVGNKININLKNKIDIKSSNIEKRFFTNTSCGICGQDVIENISSNIQNINITHQINPEKLFDYVNLLNEAQELFNKTGTTHAAAIFDANHQMISFAEDVGRHNGLDKAIGKLILANTKKDAKVIILSSRLSYEMVQKASNFGIEILAGVSSATSLAIELARKVNLTLIGFLRKNKFNIYSQDKRIK